VQPPSLRRRRPNKLFFVVKYPLVLVAMNLVQISSGTIYTPAKHPSMSCDCRGMKKLFGSMPPHECRAWRRRRQQLDHVRTKTRSLAVPCATLYAQPKGVGGLHNCRAAACQLCGDVKVGVQGESLEKTQKVAWNLPVTHIHCTFALVDGVAESLRNHHEPLDMAAREPTKKETQGHCCNPYIIDRPYSILRGR
jgi:hypothetical protein